MNHAEMKLVMDQIFNECQKLREAGQKEYAHGAGDAFANFNRVANNLDLDRKKVLFTYLYKHIDGVSSFIKGHKSQREDVRGRINDIIVYCVLLRGMIEEEEFAEKMEQEPMNPVVKVKNEQTESVPSFLQRY